MDATATPLSCRHCRKSGHIHLVESGMKAARRITFLSGGFLFIDPPEGDRRIECGTCRAPVREFTGTIAGWETSNHLAW
jgi:hypothetical protein